MDNEEEVVIIGAGICGLATALALHRKGIKSVVMEKAESLRNNTGSAIGIWQNGWRALDQLGVADVLRQTAVAVRRELIVSLADGKKQDSSMDSEFRCLKRKVLIDTLYNVLPPATVKFGCKLEYIKLDPNTSKPLLRFMDGSSISTKVVIGCDGGRSIVADFLNLKPMKMFPLCGIRGMTNYPNGHSVDSEFARFRKDNRLFGRIPIHETLVYWFFAIPYISKDDRNWEDPEVIRQSTLDLLHDFPEEIQELAKITDTNSKSLTFSRLWYRSPWNLFTGTFCKGKVVVAGDAMHVMGPFLGQGGSAGLEDAVVLGRTLGQTSLTGIESGRKITVEKAFEMFVKERRMRVVRLSLQTYLTGMLLGASSRLMKFLFLVLLVLIFRNTKGHIDYDCGVL